VRKLRAQSLLAPLGLAAVIAIAAGCCRATPPPRPFSTDIDPRGAEPFAVVGDLQTTSLLEFWREENDYERAVLVRRLADVRPAFLVVLGDLVSNGASKSAWADFDALCAPLHEARVPVLPVPGNHEYWPFFGDLDNYFDRFPSLDRLGYYKKIYGALGLVFLNSNAGELTEAAWGEQVRWYKEALGAFDCDEGVRGVLVLLHHPPYTNSTVTSDEEPVKRDFVPAFIAANKTLAMMTGHVHSYERFERGGKAFLVSGGGGGPRAALALGSERRHADDLYDGPSLRSFHYLSVTPSQEGIAIDAIGLREDGSDSFAPIDSLKLPFAREEAARGRGESCRRPP
jgi:Icc-related predicted phosphoesterase